jgi:hypothetical protein
LAAIELPVFDIGLAQVGQLAKTILARDVAIRRG